jgi:hypothetical protein
LQSSLSRPSDWKTTTGRCTSMLIQNMASVVVFELHRTFSCSLSGCIGHGFLLVLWTKCSILDILDIVVLTLEIGIKIYDLWNYDLI